MSNFNQMNSIPEWESSMMYADELRRKKIKENRQEISSNNKEKEAAKKKLEVFKKLGRLAIFSTAMYSIGTASIDALYEPTTTVDNKIGYKVNLEDTTIYRLDNQKIENFNEAKIQPEKITLEKGSVIRSNDWTYEGASSSFLQENPDTPTHTTIAKANEELSFDISEGSVIEGSNGRIGIRIENLEKTTDGRYTGIKMEADSDGWVFVDVEPYNFE